LFLERLLSSGLPRELVTMLFSAIPGFGLSISLPVAINVFKFSWYYAFILSVVGNMLPIPFLLLFWEDIEKLLAKNHLIGKWMEWLHERTQKNSSNIKKYDFLGLVIFVAVPAPMTGAATASLVAVILGMTFWPSFLAIFWGVVISAIVITSLCMLGWTGAIIAGVALGGITLFELLKTKRN
jgi:uncharacterized membrane protein